MSDCGCDKGQFLCEAHAQKWTEAYMIKEKGWIGVDLDGTLAEWHGWSDDIGAPIPAMVDRVKAWLAEGRDVRILTARGTGAGSRANAEQLNNIAMWCKKVFGRALPITDRKDMYMEVLYDDRAVGVENNTGRLMTDVAYGNGYEKAMDRAHWGSWDVS